MRIVLSHFSHVQLSATIWAIAYQVPLSMGFSRQEYWSRLIVVAHGLSCFAACGIFPDQRWKPVSPALSGRFFITVPLLTIYCIIIWAPLVAQMVKSLPAILETRVNLLVGKIPWRRKKQSTPVFLPGESHGQRNLVGYSTWDHKKQERLIS